MNPIADKLLDTNFSKSFAAAYGIRVPKELQLETYRFPLYTQLLFNKGEPTYPPIGYLLQDRFLAGDLGPTTDGESCVLWEYTDRYAPPVRRLFTDDLLRVLKTNEYDGPLSIKAIISKHDNFPYFVQFIPHQNISYYAWHELKEDEVACTVKVTLPNYPYNGHPEPKYISASHIDWEQARLLVKKKIDELGPGDWQYRIDGCIQGRWLNRLHHLGYL